MPGETMEMLLENENEIVKLYHLGHTQSDIAERFNVSPSYLCQAMKKMDVDTRESKPKSGEQHFNWEGGIANNKKGQWQKQRFKARKRDDFKCQVCGLSEDEHMDWFGQTLHVHHIKPYAEYDEPEQANELDNLVTLCRNCHFERESK